MESLRNATQSLVGKAVMTVILGVIIVSFVFWGIADVFRGFSSNNVAVVGNQTIGMREFSSVFRRALFDYQQRARANISPAQARAMGVDSQVMQHLVSDAALDDRAQRLGLGISDAAIADSIVKEPSLQDASGKFSKDKFETVLRNQGLRVEEFDAEQRKSAVRRQITASIASGVAAPKVLTQALARYEAQTRGLDYFALPAAAAGDIAAPTPEALQSWFDAHKAQYRAAETRNLTLLAVTPTSLAKPGEVSDDDAKAAYESQKQSKFTTPETRKLQQIVFANEDEAKQASEKIKAGASFEDIAKARNLKDADLDIGVGPQSAVFDTAVGAAGFALTEGGVSDVVVSKFGPALVRATGIAPSVTKAYAEVADAIKLELAKARAANEIQALHDKVEDARVSGKALPEVAKSLALDVQTLEAVDAKGKLGAGGKADIPDTGPVLSAAFASEIGADDPAISTKDGGYVWFEVTKIAPAHDRPLDEVKDQATTQWRAEETSKALSARAALLVAELAKGGDVKSAAQSVGAELKSASGVKRAGGADLPPALVAALFATPLNGANSASNGAEKIVFKVTQDATPPIDSQSEASKSAALPANEAFAEDILAQYVRALQQSVGVKIDERAMVAAEGN